MEPAASREPAAPAIELSDVSRRYGRHWALVHLSFALRRGSSLLLTGHNGSGKTTLLRVIGTAMPPSAGKLRILGQDAVAEREEVRRKVALLSHANFLYEDLSGFQNLLLMARLLGVQGAKGEVEALVRKVGLNPKDPQPIRNYSAGMRKRIAIGKLLLKQPEVALLDEPFGELDPAGIAAMEGFIAELKQLGSTIVLATHLVEQGKSLCREHLHLERGRSVAP